MSKNEIKERIYNYLNNGELSNSKYANHEKLRNLLQDCINEIDRLEKYEKLVQFINSDYVELSYEKARWQRDDWKKRANKVIMKEYGDY